MSANVDPCTCNDFADDRVSGHFADQQQPAGRLGVGEHQKVVLVDTATDASGWAWAIADAEVDR